MKAHEMKASATTVSATIAKIGILTCSDRASQGVYEDISGQAIIATLKEYLVTDWEALYRLVPDDQASIEAALRELADDEGCCFIVTTGGTGPAPRDVTPEATEAVCEKILPGFGEQMRSVSLHYVPTAILSRQTAGIRGRTLIVNLPGKPKSIRQCLDAIFPAVPYCLDLIGAAYLETDLSVMKVFRPQGS